MSIIQEILFRASRGNIFDETIQSLYVGVSIFERFEIIRNPFELGVFHTFSLHFAEFGGQYF
ncbi:hypothetical protein HARCEL1_00745 [Halococcoides cellulosivorans]|uniref:Uncharacterized protein n=1 Tax=Halococcoides cellulosivorans TaxID=1679096 RepID=A0A2R4WXT0_9EURY|nr:hypothetical protein HARCEL1_00745 [Halococcoides cellulosivorans]